MKDWELLDLISHPSIRWLFGIIGSLILIAFWFGRSSRDIETRFDTRLLADEIAIRRTSEVLDAINEDRKTKSAEVFGQLKELNRRVGVVEGQGGAILEQNQAILRRLK